MVVAHVSIFIDWNEFEQEVRGKYSEVVNIIRLKNKAQKPVNTVKLEFKSAKQRDEILKTGDISIMHMKFKVMEYLTQASVLICSKCMGIGHFRKNCPQKEETTCKTCGTSYKDQDKHLCTGECKCIHCGETHASNDVRCKVVRSYRAALTKEIMEGIAETEKDDPHNEPGTEATWKPKETTSGKTYSAAVTTQIHSTNDPIFTKLDGIMSKMSEEFMSTRDFLNEIKTEMRQKYEETKKHTAELETKVKQMEDKVVEMGGRVYAIMVVYAPASKSWDWHELSSLVERRCILMGDFNVDLELNDEKAKKLADWMDAHELEPIVPDKTTSLRSNRTIDFAMTTGVCLDIQTHEGPTNSDHKPIVGVLSVEQHHAGVRARTEWKVFHLVLSYIFPFWERQWPIGSLNDTYELFVTFLALLKNRCKCYFTVDRARISVPSSLVELLARSRNLSFKAKRNGDIELRKEAKLLRNKARYELRILRQNQLEKLLQDRCKTQEKGNLFWNRAKNHFRTSGATVGGFMKCTGEITKDPQEMADMAAEYYQRLYERPLVIRPHPYVDAPPINWDNSAEKIPAVTYPEILNVLKTRKKKKSQDIHELSPYLLEQIPKMYWHLLCVLYNQSFTTGKIPPKLQEVRIIMLAKKNAIFTPDSTRPISLLDSFLKIQEKLFQKRFALVLKNRGILPDTRSGFRADHRLQTRVLLLIEQISSYMANSAPVATVFVDFKSAFDQLWFEGCVGKLARLGIPEPYVAWIKAWLMNRKAIIEIQGKRSKWFPILRGGPQGSVFTPTLFITYHCDMENFIPGAMSFLFADDLAAVMAGQMGIKSSEQCLDLERRLQKFAQQLEFYAILTVQPINLSKTQAMFSARAIGYPNPLPRLEIAGKLSNGFRATNIWGIGLPRKWDGEMS